MRSNLEFSLSKSLGESGIGEVVGGIKRGFIKAYWETEGGPRKDQKREEREYLGFLAWKYRSVLEEASGFLETVGVSQDACLELQELFGIYEEYEGRREFILQRQRTGPGLDTAGAHLLFYSSVFFGSLGFGLGAVAGGNGVDSLGISENVSHISTAFSAIAGGVIGGLLPLGLCYVSDMFPNSTRRKLDRLYSENDASFVRDIHDFCKP